VFITGCHRAQKLQAGNLKEDCMPSEVGSEIGHENAKVIGLIMGEIGKL